MTATVPSQAQLPSNADFDYEEADEPNFTDDPDQWDQKVLQIEALIRRLSLAELNTIADHVISLVKQKPHMGIPLTMIMTEEVLAHDWNSPEDDAAWGSLTGVISFTYLFLSATLAILRYVLLWCWQPWQAMTLWFAKLPASR